MTLKKQRTALLAVAQQRKLKRRVQIFNQKIDARKYYGVGVNINNYVSKIRKHYSKNKIDEAISRFTESNDLISQIVENVMNSIHYGRELFVSLSAELEDSFFKGSNRVFNLRGDKLNTEKPITVRDLQIMEAQQSEYLNNLESELAEIVRKDLTTGFEEGKGIGEIRKDILKHTDHFTKNRANMIARSEIIKASSRGTKASMLASGVSTVVWLATIDKRTCEVCKGLHETEWNVNNSPMPVESTHPNCRCTLIVGDTE